MNEWVNTVIQAVAEQSIYIILISQQLS
jgi:hypothetical protein